MLAVIEIGGNQFTVQAGDVIETKKQDVEVDGTITVSALLVSDLEGKEVQVGTPLVKGSKVSMKALSQERGEKIRIFKKKSKKRYMRNNGFRPSITRFEVLSIA